MGAGAERSRHARHAEVKSRIINSGSNPLLVMAKIAGNESMPPEIRLAAATRLAPYIAAPMPIEANISHAHLHAHAELDGDRLREIILDRLDRLAAARQAPLL